MNIVDRVKNTYLTPTTEWPVIATDPATAGSLITGYVVPLAATEALSGFVGGSVIGRTLPIIGTYRTSLATGLGFACFTFVMAIVGVFVLSRIISALAPNFGGQKDSTLVLSRVSRYPLLLLLAVPMCAACSNSKSVNAKQVFADPAAAQVAVAAAAGDAARVDTLIKSGANPNAIGDKGVSLLQWAMLNQNKPGFEALLAASADPTHADESGNTVMHYAAKANDPWYLDVLLAHGVDLNVPNAVTGAIPMMSAMIGEREVQFHKLLAAGADPNLVNLSGDTSLHVAAEINDNRFVLDLLEAHANPAVLNKQNVTFQRYLYMTPAKLLTEDARRQRAHVTSWLSDHNVPVEDVHR